MLPCFVIRVGYEGGTGVAKVVVFGVGQWAELAHFYLTHDSPHEVVGVHRRSRVPRR